MIFCAHYILKFNLGEKLYTRYPIVARALGRVRARAKVSCIQGEKFFMGAFTYYVICRGGGGGFQKMTLDDGGEGGGFMVR